MNQSLSRQWDGAPAETNRDLLAQTGVRPFRLNMPWKSGFLGKIATFAGGSIERLLALKNLDDIYTRVHGKATSPRDFVKDVLKDLRISYSACEQDLSRIPKKGPVVIVANHPFGAIEGLILADMLSQVRDDARIMANYFLGRIPELRELFFFVDPFGGDNAARSNLGAMRQCIKWLEGGHLLAIFPAGEVSSLDLRTRQVTDKPWTPMVGRMIRRTRAAAVPVFFNGHNGAMFQIAGLLHPRLRTALLPRQLLNKRDRMIDVRLGNLIPSRKMSHIDDDQQLTDYLRQRTYMLKHRGEASAPAPAGHRNARPIAAPGDAGEMSHEIAALPAEQVLVDADDNQVVFAKAEQIPNLIKEIGRLREVTFRAAGEGSGKALDLDHFDSHYLHLMIWNRVKRELVGGYRMGASDVILKERGPGGLYTHELFDYRPELVDKLRPALELGRSFVRQEYQRSFTPLLLLWKGIGAYMVRHPRYRYLFGPVSISSAYQSTSVRLMVQFLQMHHGDQESGRLVSARTPFVAPPVRGWDDRNITSLARDEDELSDLVADLEKDQKGVPILIRQYIKLGAKFLSFNVDRAFGDCIDGLILVDLPKADRKTVERYLGREGYASYLAHWQGAGVV